MIRKLFALGAYVAWTLGALTTLASADTTLQRIANGGVVKVGFANEKPYSFKLPDGSLAGLDYELARAVFAKLGAGGVEGVAVQFGSLIPGLKAEHFDVIAAGLFIRPARCAEIAFAEPHIKIADAFLVQKGNPKNIHSLDDVVKNPDIKIATLQGSASIKTYEQLGIPDSQLSIFQDFSEDLFALKSGRVDIIGSTIFAANEIVQGDGGKTLERATPFLQPVIDGQPSVNYLGFGFRKEDADLVQKFNEALADFRKDAGYRQILAKYSVTEADVPPRDVKLSDLCK
ncbi:ectoine/hydroxyectoine ABC transporter substrate-binding protein EhuB [Rhizobium sp. A37_96]